MSIFSRIADIITANLDALLDRAENPETMLVQVIREMEDSLARARRYAAVAIAAERRLQRERDDQRGRGEQWKGRAREALAAGRDELAWRALAKKQEHDALARTLEAGHAEATQAVQSARAVLQALEARLAKVRLKQRVLLAHHRVVQLRVAVYCHLGVGRPDFGVSQDRFAQLEDRLSQRVDELAAEADLHDLSGPEAEFTDLERRLAIDRELEAMKRELESEG
jgi:phage shock protein A